MHKLQRPHGGYVARVKMCIEPSNRAVPVARALEHGFDKQGMALSYEWLHLVEHFLVACRAVLAPQFTCLHSCCAANIATWWLTKNGKWI